MVSDMRLAPRLVPFLAAVLLLPSCAHSPAQPTESTMALGEKVILGHITYTVFETQWLTQIPQDPTPRIPQSRFFLIRLSAVNSGGTEVNIPNLTVQDDTGKSYSELSNGDGVPQWIGFLRSVKPTDSIQGNIVFDAPPQHYKIRLTDENGERAAFVDLPLNFSSGGSEIQVPVAPVKK